MHISEFTDKEEVVFFFYFKNGSPSTKYIFEILEVFYQIFQISLAQYYLSKFLFTYAAQKTAISTVHIFSIISLK